MAHAKQESVSYIHAAPPFNMADLFPLKGQRYYDKQSGSQLFVEGIGLKFTEAPHVLVRYVLPGGEVSDTIHLIPLADWCYSLSPVEIKPRFVKVYVKAQEAGLQVHDNNEADLS